MNENTEEENSPLKKTAMFINLSPEKQNKISKSPNLKKKFKSPDKRKKPVKIKTSYTEIHLNQTPPKRFKNGENTPVTTAEGKQSKNKNLDSPPPKKKEKPGNIYTKIIKKGLKRYKTPERIESKVNNPKVSRLLLKKNRKKKKKKRE